MSGPCGRYRVVGLVGHIGSAGQTPMESIRKHTTSTNYQKCVFHEIKRSAILVI